MQPREVRFTQQGRGFIVPDSCTLYFVSQSDPVAETWLAQYGVLLAEGENGRFFHYPATPFTLSETPQAIWRNGLLLTQVEAPDRLTPGEQLHLQYTWQLLQKPLTGTRYQFFNHLLNQAGEIVAQEDGGGVHTVYWQPEESLIHQFYLPIPPDLPPGHYSLYTGVYTWPQLQRIPLRRSQETAYEVMTFTVP